MLFLVLFSLLVNLASLWHADMFNGFFKFSLVFGERKPSVGSYLVGRLIENSDMLFDGVIN